MSIRNDIFDALLVSVDAIRTDGATYADGKVRRVVAYQENYDQELSDQTPLLMVVDKGDDNTVVRDDSQTRYTFTVDIWGYVARHNWDRTRQELNGVQADVKKWVNSEPSIHAQVFAINFVEALPVAYDPEHSRGLLAMTLAVVYYVDNGTY